jgi:hypothetical protein
VEKTIRCYSDGAECGRSTYLDSERASLANLVNPNYYDLSLHPPIVSRIFLPVVTHVVMLPSPTGGQRPVVDAQWIASMFQIANAVWSQACVRLLHYIGSGIDTFDNIGLLAQFGTCLDPSQEHLIHPYEVTSGGSHEIVNLYLVRNTDGRACGSPVTKRVFLPTENIDPLEAGNVLAHEIGHILLNPIGVSDSDNSNHLMFHENRHPEIPPGSQNGLYLSECLGARDIAKGTLLVFPGSNNVPTPGYVQRCRTRPRLGNPGLVLPDVASNPI